MIKLEDRKDLSYLQATVDETLRLSAIGTGQLTLFFIHIHMGLVMRTPAFCICNNKDADQLRGYREANQRLCFRYTASTIPLLPKSEI